MRLRELTFLGVIGLLIALSSQVSLAAPQSSPDKNPHFFLTAFGRNDAAAVLEGNELSVLVDKTPAHVKTVHSAKDDPLLFAVLLDVSRSDSETADSLKQAAFQIFQSLTSTQSQGFLVLFNTRVAISRIPISATEAKQVLDSVRFEGGTALYDAIEQTCKQTLSRSRYPDRARRVIVLISDGEDNLSHVNHTKAEEAALEEGISIFSVVAGPSVAESRGVKFLKEASQKTGGLSTDKDIKRAVHLLLAAIDAQSEITLDSAQAGDGKLHPITIKCSQKDIHIYAPDAVLLE